MAVNDDPFLTFNFRVQIVIEDAGSLGLGNPLCESAFAECDGLEMTMEPKTYREGGNNTEHIRLAGPVTYGTLSLKRGMTRSLDLWKWFAAVAGSAGKSGTKAEGVVVMRSPDSRQDLMKFRLRGCLPIRMKAPGLNARDGLIAVEEIQIAYSAMTVE